MDAIEFIKQLRRMNERECRRIVSFIYALAERRIRQRTLWPKLRNG